jgi:lipid II:glycine glycyltransferase (peptidoglycan interpeptide bridge formation enzyme)
MVDIRQTPQYKKHLKNLGWLIETANNTNYFIKKIPFIGALMKIQRPEEINNKTINQLINKYRLFQIIVEPKTDLDSKYLLSLGFKQKKSSYLPTKTLLLDLTKSSEELFNRLKKDCKQEVKKNEESRITIYKLRNVQEFRRIWKKTVGLKRFIPTIKQLASLKKTFSNNSLFITDSGCNSGAIFLIGEKIGYYWQAFTNKEGRKIKSQYKIVWEGILWAKKRGAKVFDFEGIYDTRFPNKSWLGFTHFKKSFGGYEVEYPGCFVKFKMPL